MPKAKERKPGDKIKNHGKRKGGGPIQEQARRVMTAKMRRSWPSRSEVPAVPPARRPEGPARPPRPWNRWSRPPGPLSRKWATGRNRVFPELLPRRNRNTGKSRSGRSSRRRERRPWNLRHWRGRRPLPRSRTTQSPRNRPDGRRRAPNPRRTAELTVSHWPQRKSPLRLSAAKLQKHGPPAARRFYLFRKCALRVRRQILRPPGHGQHKYNPPRRLPNHGRRTDRPLRQRRESVCGNGPWTNGRNRPRSLGRPPPRRSTGSLPRPVITGNLSPPPAAPFLRKKHLLLKINPSIHQSKNGPGPPLF